MKKISVSLLVFNEKHNLEKTIIKAYKELEKLYLEFELWVFDNCSNDGTDVLVNSLLKKYKNLRYYKQEKNFGYAINCQTALKLPVSDYKFVIDGDGQYDLEDVKECIEILDSGYEVPKDFSIAGFDDTPVTQMLNPPLSTVKQPLEKMGELAAKKLIAELEGLDFFENHKPKSSLIIRESIAER